MTLNPYLIAMQGIANLEANKVILDNVIRVFETKSLSLYNGIRPTLPVSAFPSFEIELQNVDTEWATCRGQRHTCSFRCLVTVCAPKIGVREEYLAAVTNAVLAIFKNPKYLQFPIGPEHSINGEYQLYAFDSFVNSASYSSVKEGTYGVAEFTWTVKVHERIPDILFRCVSDQAPNIEKPIVKEIQ